MQAGHIKVPGGRMWPAGRKLPRPGIFRTSKRDVHCFRQIIVSADCRTTADCHTSEDCRKTCNQTHDGQFHTVTVEVSSLSNRHN